MATDTHVKIFMDFLTFSTIRVVFQYFHFFTANHVDLLTEKKTQPDQMREENKVIRLKS